MSDDEREGKELDLSSPELFTKYKSAAEIANRSAFMFGRGLTSIPWGIVADRYGRPPVAILGIIPVTSFWMAVTSRFFLGALNGLLGPMKAYAVEIFEMNTKL